MAEPSAEGRASASVSPANYGKAYFAEYFGGIPYDDVAHWTRFFADTADHIVREIGPKTTLDVGCAMGYLVEALRARGVGAWGIDFSDYAIDNARKAARDFCRVGSILDPFPHPQYDLITCIEVVEHLPVDDAERAIENLCRHTDDIVFTSTPSDFGEETHLNVRPPEYWGELFARQGFFRDVDFEAPYLAVWASRFRRGRDPLPRVVATYERSLWHLRQESFERGRLITKQLDEANRGRDAIADNHRLASEVSDLTAQLVAHKERVARLEAEIASLRAKLDRLSSSTAGHLMLSIEDRARRIAPSGTRRRSWLQKLVGRSVVDRPPR